jgi:hypothetical protein
MKRSVEQTTSKISAYLENLLFADEEFTGKIELNFKDGDIKDINETKRTKFD